MVGVGIGAGLISLIDARPANPTYTSHQVADAKSKVCAVYQEVHHAVGVNSARDKGTDPVQQLAVTATMRQAFLAGSLRLLTTLSDEPATPRDLAGAVHDLANVFQEVTVGYLDGKTNSELEPTLTAGDDATSRIERLCK
ncbi:hypothetical protein [Mycobacterium xenopi]|uniref:Alanine and proline rich membrane protein n=1 Tax=Mycobacterium xenopi 4042 TaxID=1299334 RepID=X8BE32_MYCXE|nr:hypothetical protein [Mycobacterium xenopi]EUA42124.1 hypothetical protein I553_5984 [Mycobacterium xenopi 4042]MDA3640220.1 hypothetical protein [Mycobacterium xenopi]MDA3658384.1 hypothetical protein [Mycobacterium xenopi]MDA3662508.1 hypothetical protein [Mycobacterium xenopi]